MIKKTAINEYFQWLKQSVNSNSQLYQTVSGYLDMEDKKQLHEGPFLTVITRTQGKRKHMLAETLLCLQGQSNTNFELLIMAHNLSEERQEVVNTIIEDLPEWFQEKIRLIPVQGGTRTTPLNVGFEMAKGEYIAILDDDDIVFDNWVECFYELAKENNGKMLHTYAVDQKWEVVGDEEIPRAAGAPDTTYCHFFDLKRQMSVNACPLHSVAFPTFVFQEMGIKFDESLNTTEDWDFLMRTAFVTGVVDKKEITCIYRRWCNAENSQMIHDEDEWNENYMYIVDKLRSMPMIILPNTYDDIFDPVGKHSKLIRSKEAQLFYDDGNGFVSNCVIGGQECKINSDSLIEFDFDEEHKEVLAVRIDPMDNGGFAIDKLEVKIEFASGDNCVYRVADVKHNGVKLRKGEIVFLKDDPQIIICFKQAVKINKVYVAYELINPLNDDIVRRLLGNRGLLRKVIMYAIRKIRGLSQRIWSVFK